jgi:aminoglycoside 3'-phosphotransferase-2
MSGASVFRVAAENEIEHYLKIGPAAVADLINREIERTKWLASVGIRVPNIVACFSDEQVAAVTMSALDGQTAEGIVPTEWRPAVAAIARAFRHLHSLPLGTCPFDETLAIRMMRARDLVESGTIDPAHFDERNSGLTAKDLYDRLVSYAPEDEDCVVTHGDAMLSNVIMGDNGQIGFVDCSHCGRADRYVDLALLLSELSDRLGTEACEAFTAAYGDLRWDEGKAEFYRDLYELF